MSEYIYMMQHGATNPRKVYMCRLFISCISCYFPEQLCRDIIHPVVTHQLYLVDTGCTTHCTLTMREHTT